MALASLPTDDSCRFVSARPIWLTSRSREANVQAGFRASVTAHHGRSYAIRVTAATVYRLLVNGRLVAYGPARSPHGFLRVDEVPLTEHLDDGENAVCLEVAGYNCGCVYQVGRPSFVQAEVFEDDRTIAATGVGRGVAAIRLSMRHQRVVRFSYQRAFTEIYTINREKPAARWNDPGVDVAPFRNSTEVVDHASRLLPRGTPMPRFTRIDIGSQISLGSMAPIEHPAGFSYPQKQFFSSPSPGYKTFASFSLEEIPENPYYTLQDFTFRSDSRGRLGADLFPRRLKRNRFALYDLGRIVTGFIGTRVIVGEDATILLVFDEKLTGEAFAHMPHWATINVVTYHLGASSSPYDLLTFEPYGLRYVAVVVLTGDVTLTDLFVREYAYPCTDSIVFSSSDARLVSLFFAARESFRQNALDVLMDNAHRERGAYLLESFFSAASIPFLSQDPAPETCTLENYALVDRFPGLEKGHLPMVYPSDFRAACPSFSLWYILELGEYVTRIPNADLDRFRPLVEAILARFEQFLNREGLLENVGPDFWEWSAANEFTNGVHFPLNMLYAKALAVFGRLYELNAPRERAAEIRSRIIDRSFDGESFRDNATRNQDGTLHATGNRSEYCQHLAFLLDTVDAEDVRFFELARRVVHEMGPMHEREIPEVASYGLPGAASAPVFEDVSPHTTRLVPLGLSYGYLSRLRFLLRRREYQAVLDECIHVFHPMACFGGTLWEHKSLLCEVTGLPGLGACGCNQGSASFVGAAVIRAAVGLQRVDLAKRTVTLDFADVEIRHVRYQLATPHGDILIERTKDPDGPHYVRYCVPNAYKVELVPPSGRFHIHASYCEDIEEDSEGGAS